jgi:cytochrome c
MKTIKKCMLLGAVACGLAQAADGLNSVHPGYSFTDIQPTGKKIMAGGVDAFSDGRLAVCNWGNPGDVLILENAKNGTAATVKSTRFASGLRQVLGCKVVRDTLYVMQMDELTQLVDTDGDGVADQYNRVNNAFATSESNLAFAYDVLYHAGSFYAIMSSDVAIGGMDYNPSLPGRSQFLRLNRDNTTNVLASGFRNPNGMGKGFGNRLFSVDNQGSWLPSSKIIHLQEGKFYGHKNNATTPYQDQPETWPMCWLPHGDVAKNPGNLLFIPSGLYKNQLFFTDLLSDYGGRIYRISIQEVNGVMQGAVIPFSSGFTNGGGSRLAYGPDGSLYLGELGSTGGWNPLSSIRPGMKRINQPTDLNKSQAFEILAERSTGPNTVELEFTEPVAQDANLTSKYTVRTWTFEPQVGYGAGNMANLSNVVVNSATIKADGKTVELNMTGLKEKYLLHIKLVGLTSATGQAVWTPQTWFTINKFGPGTVPPIAGCRNPAYADYDPTATVDDPKSCVVQVTTEIQPFANVPHDAAYGPLGYLGQGRIRLDLDQNAPYELSLMDVNGRAVKEWRGRGPAEIDAKALLAGNASRGILFLKLRTGARTWSRSILSPL